MQQPMLVLDPAASGRIVVKVQISSSGDYLRLARHLSTNIATGTRPMISDLIQLDRRDFSRPLATCRPCHIGNDEKQKQYQRHERFRAIFRQIVRNKCRDPREGESSIGPLLDFVQAGYNEDRNTANLSSRC